jgi:hypothetical protein
LVYPATPILLECAGTVNPRDSRPSTRHWETLYILWQFRADSNSWAEIARALSPDWGWAIDLVPIAQRLLKGAPGSVRAIQPPAETAKRLRGMIADEFDKLSAEDRQVLAPMLYNEVCSELSRW